MRIAVAVILLFVVLQSFGQLEFASGFAVNKREAAGAPIHIGYDIKIAGRWYMKPQAGFKFLQHYNDWVEANIKVSIWELHHTVSYELVRRRSWILKPNIGINYRWYRWTGKMEPPYNTLPQRQYTVEFRDRRLRINSFDQHADDYKVSNLGFSFQLQNQFKLTDQFWFHLTPFLEPDYDGTQSTGGCYIGLLIKKK